MRATFKNGCKEVRMESSYNLAIVGADPVRLTRLLDMQQDISILASRLSAKFTIVS
jgi:hypothetical protein